ncbi:glycosyltransferase [Demequina sp. SYSU T00192]|uniref:Glycosyltransferase n=1 Tax=Demequina litoralis TaxID=3051660 RepID=A0ABT8G5K7_9MICO|nr:glycosyltransferase [Demequina sp. SYSU T00192]MDN4474357.1 glycosyltransferase [Demequina sp. SYSU T00192]
MSHEIVTAFVLTIAVVLLVQAVASLVQTLYIWDSPERIQAAGRPATFARPKHGFTVLLPARHEADVIGETLRKLGEARYPSHLVELMVICTADDTETIAAAEEAAREHDLSNVTVLVFRGRPGKSRAMNLGLEAARHEIVTIFDSEDDVSPEIFSIVDTLYQRRAIDVLQCGVQLMDHDSHWFSAHNVLEYFFWFKSRMHYFAKEGAVPLGGNTVFFRASDLREVDGWDEHGLTEDADLGIRLSLAGKRFGVMYDAEHVTREEVPHSTGAFIKQRTRWNQGFLQVIRKGDWLRLPSLRQKVLIGSVLTAPTFMAIVIACAPLFILIGLTMKLPVLVSLLTFVPLMLAVVMLATSVLGLYEFGKDQGLRISPYRYLALVVSFIPYQGLLMVSAVRAGYREVTGRRGWEKTVHTGRHRIGAAEARPVLAPVMAQEAA